MPFRAPVSEYEFMLRHVVDYDKVAATTKFQDAGLDVVDAILNEAGKMCNEVMAPVQRNGDLHPAVLENGVVRTSWICRRLWRDRIGWMDFNLG